MNKEFERIINNNPPKFRRADKKGVQGEDHSDIWFLCSRRAKRE